MPILNESHRAPADPPKMGLRRIIQTAVESRFWPTRFCRHSHPTLPFNNRQNCPDCGSARLYLFNCDFEHAAAGIVIGPWVRPRSPRQDARQVVAATVMANAIAPAIQPQAHRSAIDIANDFCDRHMFGMAVQQ